MPVVLFSYADVHPRFAAKTALKAFIAKIFEFEAKSLRRLQYVFCSDRFLLEMNRTHLNHDEFTDIITFDLSETTEIIGEIYISVERVEDNAHQFNTGFAQELHRVMFHGALHLCGYPDKKKSESVIMRSKEDHYLRLYHSNLS